MYVSGAHILYSVHIYNIGSLFYVTSSICHLLQVLHCVCVCVHACGTVTSYDLYGAVHQLHAQIVVAMRN